MKFVREIVGAIHSDVAADLHLQMKTSATDRDNDVFPWERNRAAIDENSEPAWNGGRCDIPSLG